MDRSTIYLRHQKGWTNVGIADFLGHHRDTIARVLREPRDQQAAKRQRTSSVAVFDVQIRAWLDQHLSVQRMLDLARADPDHPDRGKDAAFYDYVRPIKRARKLTPEAVPIRFEGLPGELLQIDWGETRHFPFTRPDLKGQTRYFFAARLKDSRFMFVRFTTEMREETLLRCLIACFVQLGGVPWVVTSDNMKTITLGRESTNRPSWHPAFQQCAVEFGFHPDGCTPSAANQKGAVENLVKFVKGNFLAGRTFYDDAELEHERALWIHQVNEVRPSDATEQIPRVLRAAEQPKFGPLPAMAAADGFFDSVKVSRESMVALATNRYSVPAQLVGLALTVRIYATRISCSTVPPASRPTHASLGGMCEWSYRNTSRRSLPASRAPAVWSTATGWWAYRPPPPTTSLCCAASAMPRWTAKSQRCTRWHSNSAARSFWLHASWRPNSRRLAPTTSARWSISRIPDQHATSRMAISSSAWRMCQSSGRANATWRTTNSMSPTVI